MAIFDYKPEDFGRFLPQTCPLTEVTAKLKIHFQSTRKGATVWFGYRSRMERFERFRLSVLTALLGKRFSVLQCSSNRKARFQFRLLKKRFLRFQFFLWFLKDGSDGSGLRFQISSSAILPEITL